MPRKRIDWERRGFADYPNCHMYPKRDKYGPRIEKKYLTGWWKKHRVILSEKLVSEIERGIVHHG